MTLNKNKQNFKTNHSVTGSYIGFVFQTVLKRPFGYITAVLYIVYLAVILLIVPKAVHLNPLFIWSNPAFNMPIFNLIFIAAATSSMAVAVFKTGNEDGTDLLLSAKPITKRTRILSKILVYFITMILMCLIITCILTLIKPVFGELSIFNLNGISNESYKSLLGSILLGNLINILFFGAIAVLISMVGGQVITLIGTIGTAFILCLLNVLFPLTISSPIKVLNDTYNTSINSIAAPTRNQFNNPDAAKQGHINFAAIDCTVKEDGSMLSDFDTYEYWNKVNKESGLKATNYIDIGKQLSNIYSSVGNSDNEKLEAAKKQSIGASSSFNYTIDKDSKISIKNNIDKKEYPISIYATRSKQGYTYPVVEILSGGLRQIGGWTNTTQRNSYDWNTVAMVTDLSYSESTSDEIMQRFNNKPWMSMSEIKLTDVELNQAKIMFTKILEKNPEQYHWQNEDSAMYTIIAYNNNVFWNGEEKEFFDLPHAQRFNIVGRIQIAWTCFAQEWQNEKLKEYCKTNNIDDSFPYSSKTFMRWHYEKVELKDLTHGIHWNHQMQIKNIFSKGINFCHYKLEPNIRIFSLPPRHTLEYCETYKNLYKYDVTNFYNSTILIIVWSVLSAGMFSISIVVYRKTDFK